MQASYQAIKLIKEFEAFRPKAYLCPAGYKTIGYGHLLKKWEQIENIDIFYAQALLRQDIYYAEQAVRRYIQINLTQGQFDALVSFVFNLGAASLQRSSLRQKINRAEHNEVPKEFRRWVYANGVILPGLVIRREAEVRLYLAHSVFH